MARTVRTVRKSKEEVHYPRHVKELCQIMEEAKEQGQLRAVMEEEFKKPVSMTGIWECRSYFHMEDENGYEGDTVLLSIRALLATMEGKLKEARCYADMLCEAPEPDEEELTREKFFRLILEMVLPDTTDKRFFQIVCFLERIHTKPIQSLILSACRPSILDGFRDFTPYGKYLVSYKDEIMKSVQTLYGNSGKGVYEVALAEWNYQNNKCFDALVLVTGTIPLLESEQDVQCLFVAMALQFRILLVNGQTKMAEPYIKKIRERIQRGGRDELESSLDALECRAALYGGNMERIEAWLEYQAPDENKELYMMDMYAYLIKIRCYLLNGKHMMAIVLAKRLINLIEPVNRYMDLCECYMLSAMACYKAKDNKRLCEELQKALDLAKQYGYYRLLADEGACMVEMLKIYHKEAGADSFTEDVLDLAGSVASHFPDYLKSPGERYGALTEREAEILRLMARGMSNDMIAEELDKKVGTVKFHTANIFKKLKVQNRQQAVERGYEIGFIGLEKGGTDEKKK